MEWWLKLSLLVIGLVWLKRLASALRQRRLSKALLRLLQRMDTGQPGVFDPQRAALAAAQQAVAASAWAPLSVLRPSAWLRANLEAARALMVIVDALGKNISAGDQTALTRLLDAEQKLLARSKLAFSPNPGSSACRHIVNPPFDRHKHEDQWRALIPQIEFHTQGNRAFSRSWCRHCLTGFEDQSAIAVNGGH